MSLHDSRTGHLDGARRLRSRPVSGRGYAGSAWAVCLLAGILALLGAAVPRPTAAQSGPLQVTIARPGEGETLYAGPDSPRTAIHVVGWAGGGDFDLSEIELQLVVLQNGTPVGRVTGAPDAEGVYSFWVSINPLGPEEAGRTSGNCWPCHGYAPVALPPGPSVIRVTAVEPTGRTAVAERSVRLDRSEMARLDVRVTVAGQPGEAAGRAVAGLPVTASTRIYDWRSRQFSAKTDALGRAALALEALAQAPTSYRIGLPPTVVDGTLYRSSRPVELILPAGASSAGPVDLVVEAQLGRIDGAVSRGGRPLASPVTVHAVDLLSGRAFATRAEGGKFAFDGVPISRYLVAANPDEAAASAGNPTRTEVDLVDRPEAGCTLDLDPAAASSKDPPQTAAYALRGAVRDVDGRPAPFAWLESGDGKTASPAGPVSGVFAWPGLPSAGRVLRVSAPGYWSRVIPARGGTNVEVRLQSRPDTRIFPWGSGRLIVPVASLAGVDGEKISLRRGWAWGSGDGPLTIETPDASLSIPAGGRFAVEYIPGETAWLYVLEGEARVGATSVKAGEMAAFAGKGIVIPRAVPLDETAVRLLRQESLSPILFEPAGGARAWLDTALAYAGIAAPGPAQTAGGAAAVALLAIGTVYILRRRRRPS